MTPSPGPGRGSGTCSHRITGGGPYSRNSAAYTVRSPLMDVTHHNVKRSASQHTHSACLQIMMSDTTRPATVVAWQRYADCGRDHGGPYHAILTAGGVAVLAPQCP